MVLKKAECVFFRGMLAGYAGDVKAVAVPDMPGFKQHLYGEGYYLFCDRWCVNPDSGKSEGSTRIWFNEKPIWVMHYGGYYPKEVIPFLKLALANTYGDEEFVGGRGRNLYSKSNNLVYFNTTLRGKFPFSDFEGHEEIRVFKTRDAIGSHKYWGMALI